MDLINLESKLRGLENDLLLNQKTIEKIKETVDEMQKEQVNQNPGFQTVFKCIEYQIRTRVDNDF